MDMTRSIVLGGALALLSACTIPFGSAPPETARALRSPAPAAGAPGAVSFPELQGVDWVPDEPGFAAPGEGRGPALRFLDGDRVSGSGGCNRFTGPANAATGAVRIGPLASTRMACPGDAMQAEARFLSALERARGARLDDGRLTLLDGAGAPLLRLARAVTAGARADVGALAAPRAAAPDAPSAPGGGGLAAAAAARGVRFLGRGNEPGWRVEIGPGDLVRVVHRYGTVRADFPGLAARTLPNGDTVHEGAAGGHSVRIILRSAACADDMGGEIHPVTVLLRFDGEERRGCGGPLPGR